MGKMLLHLATATRWFLEASINVLEISSKALINSIAIFAYGLLSLSLYLSLETNSLTMRRSYNKAKSNQISNSTTKNNHESLNKELYVCVSHSQISHMNREYHIRTLPHLHRMHMNRSCRRSHRHLRRRRQRVLLTQIIDYHSQTEKEPRLIHIVVLFAHCVLCASVWLCHHLFECRAEFLIGLHAMNILRIRARVRLLACHRSNKECRFITKRKSHECIHNMHNTHFDCYCCGVDDIKYAEKRNEKKKKEQLN